MQRFHELARLLPKLKGARGSVVWALTLAGRPLSSGELALLTGYSLRTLRRTIPALLEQGFIRRDGPRVFALTGEWPYLAAGSSPEAIGVPPAVGRPTTEVVDADPARSSARNSGPEERETDWQGAREPEDSGAELPAARLAGFNGDWDVSGHDGRRKAQSGPESASYDRQEQQIVGVADQDPTQHDDQQQQQIPKGAKKLAAVLRQMGVNGRAYRRLLARPDLAASPELALGWWWYYRAQEGIRNPTGAAINRLTDGDPPPEGYLALAQIWPRMDDELRLELESLALHNWSAEQIVATLEPECPGLTAGAVLAFMSLGLEALEH